MTGFNAPVPERDPALGGWIGVDLDGTLAEAREGVHGPIGAPVPGMVIFVKRLLAAGWEVRIFTARADLRTATSTALIEVGEWCEKNIGKVLHVTSEKDRHCFRIYDDRARQVVYNSGEIVCLEVVNAAMQAANKDAALGNELVALLTTVAGDHGQSEGAAECLTRILNERKQFIKTLCAVESERDKRWQQLQRTQQALRHWKGNHAAQVKAARLLRLQAERASDLADANKSNLRVMGALKGEMDRARERAEKAEKTLEAVMGRQSGASGAGGAAGSTGIHTIASVCSYCGIRFNGTPEDMRSQAAEHMKVCAKHPMRVLEAELDRLRSQLAIAEAMPEQFRKNINDYQGALIACRRNLASMELDRNEWKRRAVDAERDAEAVKKMTVLGDDFYLTHSNTLKEWIISVEDGKHGKEWADANLLKALSKAQAAVGHLQIPCIYCGGNHETIQPGPCPKNPMSPGNKPWVEAEQSVNSGEVASLDFLRDNVLSQHHIQKHGLLDAIQRHVADYEALWGLVAMTRQAADRNGGIVGEPLADFANRLGQQNAQLQAAHDEADKRGDKLGNALLTCYHRLALHDGCSRYGVDDAIVLDKVKEALDGSCIPVDPDTAHVNAHDMLVGEVQKCRDTIHHQWKLLNLYRDKRAVDGGGKSASEIAPRNWDAHRYYEADLAIENAERAQRSVNTRPLPMENFPCVTPPFVPGPEAAHGEAHE